MAPVFLPKAFVFCLAWPKRWLKVDDVILFDHHHYGKMIKRIVSLNPQGLYVAGDNPESLTTEQMGQISYSDIMGKVVIKINPAA